MSYDQRPRLSPAQIEERKRNAVRIDEEITSMHNWYVGNIIDAIGRQAVPFYPRVNYGELKSNREKIQNMLKTLPLFGADRTRLWGRYTEVNKAVQARLVEERQVKQAYSEKKNEEYKTRQAEREKKQKEWQARQVERERKQREWQSRQAERDARQREWQSRQAERERKKREYEERKRNRACRR